MSHAAQPSSSPPPSSSPSPSPSLLVHLLSDLWPHTDIMLTSGPHLSLCPQTSRVFSFSPPKPPSPPPKKESCCSVLWSTPSITSCLISAPYRREVFLTHLSAFSLSLSLSLSLSIYLSHCLLSPKQPFLVFLLWGLFTCSCDTFLDVPHTIISACRVQK